MDTGPRLFRFVIITKSNGSNEAELISLDEGSRRFPLDDVHHDGKRFGFHLKVSKAQFDGQYSEDQKSLSGKWTQQGASFDLVLHRVDAVPKDEPSEIWLGTLNAGFQKLRIQLRAYHDQAGDRVFMDSLDQKVGGFKATRTLDGNRVQIDVPGIRAQFVGTLNVEAGRLNAEATEMVGKWSQGLPMALTFKRVESVANPSALEPKRPQHPKPPFPYSDKEIAFPSDSGKIELAGTITIPSMPGPHPLAILISGSGPQDRNETLFDHRPFLVIADHLTRNGIAVLRFDDRGVGKSTGKFAAANTMDFASDVQAAVNYARSLPEIASKQIGLIGHSEGGLIAPMVASQDQDIAWIVLLASPGVNGEQILYSQGQLIVAAEGGTQKDMNRQRRIQELAFQTIKTSEPGASIEPHVQKIVEQILDPATDQDADPNKSTQLKSALAALIRANLLAMKDPWFLFFSSHEPGPVLEKVRCPVLAMTGTKDVQVDPKLNLPKIEESLRKGGNPQFAIRELPGLNHLFQTCQTGGLSEYQTIEETFAPLALETMSNWIRSLPERR
jgi:hypothetical protein